MNVFFVDLKEAESDQLASRCLTVHYGQRVIDQAMPVVAYLARLMEGPSIRIRAAWARLMLASIC
jgi:hypothetical protein